MGDEAPAGDAASGPPERRRRPRYRGTHPRRFAEKYKERGADADPDFLARVRARGQTPAGRHVPVLLEPVLAALQPRPGERGVDATLGWGGHAERLLAAIQPGGFLLGLDADPIELPKTEARLRGLGFGADTFAARRTNFAGISAALAAQGWQDGVDFLLADLGTSSMQLDDPGRGFGAKEDGPLDMRMNPRRGHSAAAWLAASPEHAIAAALRDHADEPQAARVARALADRAGQIHTTHELAAAVRAALTAADRAEQDLAVRRAFQALRIVVNDEFGALAELLRQLPACLRPGGRAALISFHSGEDRRVKQALRDGVRSGIYAATAESPVRADPAERRDNPRAIPAKMRWVLRAAAP